MIDSHAHIDVKAFEADRAEVLQRAWDAGVRHIVVPDIEPARRQHLAEIVSANDGLSRGVGVHPHHVANLDLNELYAVELEATAKKVVAIGEIGLDYYYDFAPKNVQQLWFREQIRIAKRVNLPIIVHNREADNDVLTIIEEEQDGTLRGVLHCFSSGTDTLKRALNAGMLVSFTGNITFKRSTLHDVVTTVPDDRFMIETDSPYITPEPHRGKRNEPALVQFVAERIAEIRGTTMQRIIDLTTTTAQTFFKLALTLAVVVCAANAQPKPPRDEDYPDDRDWELALDNYFADSVAWEKWIKPRKIGVGLSLGSLTVIELQQYLQRWEMTSTALPTDPSRWSYYEREAGPQKTASFDGLLAFGGSITYGVTTHLVLEATIVYSQNSKPAQDFGLDPITTWVGEISALYSLNPYSKVNFLPQLGLSYANINDGTIVRAKYGLNAGIGIGMNIPTSIGLFYPMFNVRYNFLLGTDLDRVVRVYSDPVTGETYKNSAMPTVESVDLADVNSIYSIPRFTLVYYLPF